MNVPARCMTGVESSSGGLGIDPFRALAKPAANKAFEAPVLAGRFADATSGSGIMPQVIEVTQYKGGVYGKSPKVERIVPIADPCKSAN